VRKNGFSDWEGFFVSFKAEGWDLAKILR
jgi:hypothetical protein